MATFEASLYVFFQMKISFPAVVTTRGGTRFLLAKYRVTSYFRAIFGEKKCKKKSVAGPSSHFRRNNRINVVHDFWCSRKKSSTHENDQ